MTHESYMRQALELAREAALAGEIPVGAVIVRQGRVVASDRNRREELCDPTAHAEILALRAAAAALGTRRLNGCVMYVTLEPCPMCAGALTQSLLDACYFGARDARQGCCQSVYALTMEPSFYHRLPCVGGVLENEAAGLLTEFFAARRSEVKQI